MGCAKQNLTVQRKRRKDLRSESGNRKTASYYTAVCTIPYQENYRCLSLYSFNGNISAFLNVLKIVVT